jgi:hypothetical protein
VVCFIWTWWIMHQSSPWPVDGGASAVSGSSSPASARAQSRRSVQARCLGLPQRALPLGHVHSETMAVAYGAAFCQTVIR